MIALGFELRKIRGVDSLYNEVDLILAKYQSSEIQRQTIAHTLNKMIKTENWFSVCVIKECAEICQIVIPKERMCIYNAIHCMCWNEMLPDYRQMIIALILDDFRAIFATIQE